MTEKSIVERVNRLSELFAKDMKAALGLIGGLDNDVGSINDLSSEAKLKLVAALNEVKQQVSAIDLAALISDGTVDTHITWNSTKITDAVTRLLKGTKKQRKRAQKKLLDIATVFAERPDLVAKYPSGEGLADDPEFQAAMYRLEFGDPDVLKVMMEVQRRSVSSK
jgi:hypothetical protein